MKTKFSLSLAILFYVLLHNPGYAQSVPTCLTSDSDSDSDGYGWENNATCLVDANAGTSMTGQCENRGGFPWGWDPITLTSCRLDEQQTELTIELSPLAQAIVGNWSSCTPFYLQSPAHNPTGGNNRSDEVTSASWQKFVQTSSSASGTNSAIYAFHFQDTGGVEVRYLFDDGVGDWVFVNDTSWSLESHNLSFADGLESLGVTPPIGVGFENINDEETFHIYLTTTYRISCAR